MRSTMVWVAVLCLLAGCDSKDQTGAKSDEKSEQPTTAKQVPDQAPDDEPKPTPDGPKSTAFDLMANRHLAHVWDGALIVDIGHPAAVKYVGDRERSGWTDATELEGAHVAYLDGTEATLRVPLHSPEDEVKSWKLSVRMRPIGTQRCDFFVQPDGGEETKAATLEKVEPGWNVHTVDLSGAKSGAENKIRIACSKARRAAKEIESAAAVDWIALGSEPVEAITREQGVFDTLGSRVRLDEGDAVWWYAPLAEGAEFHAGVEGLVDLVVASDAKPAKTYASEQGKFKVNLSDWGGDTVRVGLVARGTATLTRPRIDVPRAEASSKPKEPKYVFLWVADGLRADHLSTYVKSATTETPNYDAFAAEAVVFDRAIAQSSDPLSSAATVFTGAYPPRHGLLDSEASVPRQVTVLAQPFAAMGFETGLFAAGRVEAKENGLTPGFDHLVQPDTEEGTRPIEDVWPKAEAWLEGREPPAFLFFRTVETSPPLQAPPALLSKYSSGAAPASMDADDLFGRLAAGQRTLNEAETGYLHAMYQAAVTQNDLWFGSALETLDKLGIRDDTLIVVTSTAGLAVGEGGRFGFGSTAHESVWVPLMVQYRAWRREGGRVKPTIELVDLYETLVELAKLGRLEADHLQGESVRELMLDPTARHPRPAFSYEGDELGSVRVADWTYRPTDERLFRRADAAPFERDPTPPAEAIAWRAVRDFTPFHVRWLDRWDKSEWGYPNNHSEDAARELDREGW